MPVVGIAGVLAGGATEGGKPFARAFLACLFSYYTLSLFDLHHLWHILYAVALYVGMAPGHGHPVGWIIRGSEGSFKEREWWEPNIPPYPALALRGALHLHPAFVISLPLGMWLAKQMPDFPHMNTWRWWEVYKYVIVYALVLAIH